MWLGGTLNKSSNTFNKNYFLSSVKLILYHCEVKSVPLNSAFEHLGLCIYYLLGIRSMHTQIQ